MQLKTVLLSLAVILVSNIRGYFSFENQCIYSSDANLCSSCHTTQHVNNMTFPESNGITLHFCSHYIPLDSIIRVEGRVDINLVGIPGENVTIKCTSKRDAGIAISSTSNIKISDLILIGCGLSTYSIGKNQPYAGESEKSSISISNSCNVSLDRVKVIGSLGIGLLLLNTVGRVNIGNCIVENSHSPRDNQQDGGGGLYVEISESCAAISKTNKNCSSIYNIHNCIFKQNTASGTQKYSDFVSPNDFNASSSVNLGSRGGGIGIIMRGTASRNSISISDSQLVSNSALWGGGIYALFQDLASYNVLIVNNVEFLGNMCPERGGGGLAIGLISVSQNWPQNNLIQLESCNFDSNNASYGGGVTFYASESSDYPELNNSIGFNNCSWTNNSAFIGAAVDLSSHIWKETKGGLPKVTFTNCLFLFNTIHHSFLHEERYTHHTKGKGVFYSVGYVVSFSGNTLFHGNKGSAMYLISSVANFSYNSNIEFSSNEGFSGGAVTLLGFSALNIRDNTTCLFQSNTAKDRGGAIIAVTINKKDLIDTQVCFIQYSGNLDDVPNRNIEFIFMNNSAGAFGRNKEVEGHYGHSIFTSSLIPCHRQCIHKNRGYDYDLVLDCIGNFTFINKNTYDITTSGWEMKLIENITVPLNVIPGKLVKLPISMTDEFSNQVGDLYHVLVNNINFSNVAIDFSDAYISEKWIRFYGTPGDTADITIETINIREIGLTFKIKIQECSPGYVQDTISKDNIKLTTCVCSASTKSKRYSGIYRCNNTNNMALLKRGYWMGYDQSGEYGTEDKLLSGYCPRGYCITNRPRKTANREYHLPQNTSIQGLNKFICGPNRTGTVCGKCVADHSAFYHSRTYKCKRTDECKWGWLFYLLSEIVPVTILFVVITVFNIKLTTGAFNAFLYYAQLSDTMLITANGFIVFPYYTYVFVRINHFIARMFNLNFFAVSELSFCLWKSAETLDLVLFKYVTIVYALLLVFVIIAMMRFCNCSSKHHFFSKIVGKTRSARATIIHGLTGFLVMCYSECIRISILILTPVSLETSSREGNSYIKQVVFYNGELKFFKGEHLYYAIPALFVLLVFGILPPILLLSYPLCYKIFAILKISESKFVSLLCKCIPLESFRPFFDSFQSTFKDKYRFFAGLYFIYRLITLFSFAYFHNLTEFYLTVQAQLILVLAVHTIIQPYKKRWHNVIDGIIFMVLAIINAITLFNYKHATGLLNYERLIHTTSKIQTALLYIPLLYMGIYIAIVTYRKTNFMELYKKLKRKTKNKKSSIEDNRHMNLSIVVNGQDSCDDFLDSDYHHRPLADDDNGQKI